MSLYLSLFEVFKYLSSTPASRYVRKGECIVNAGHLILCGITKFSGCTMYLQSLCLQTSALTSPPHEITGTFNVESGNVIVQEMVCTCKAGLGEKCKHIAAVLIHCTRHNMAQFEKVSSTDMKCIWAKKKESSLASYKPEPLADFKCINYIPLEATKDEQNIRQFLMSAVPDSVLAVHQLKRKSSEATGTACKLALTYDPITEVIKNAGLNKANGLTEDSIFPLRQCCQAIFEDVIICNVEKVCMETKEDYKKWQLERQFRITGSRCYALYTYKGSDWEMKRCKYFWPKQFSTIYTRHGITYENEARSIYSRNLGRTVIECGLVVSKSNPFFAYSPDGVVFENNVPSKLLEIKCPYKGREVTAGALIQSCDYLKFEHDRIVLKQNHAYYEQVQFGMAILNLESCDFVVFSSFDKSFLNIVVPFDIEFTSALLHKLKCIYFQHMLHTICDNKIL